MYPRIIIQTSIFTPYDRRHNIVCKHHLDAPPILPNPVTFFYLFFAIKNISLLSFTLIFSVSSWTMTSQLAILSHDSSASANHHLPPLWYNILIHTYSFTGSQSDNVSLPFHLLITTWNIKLPVALHMEACLFWIHFELQTLLKLKLKLDHESCT